MTKNAYVAFLPIYDAYGQNCTQVYYADGTSQIYPVSVKQFKKQLYYDRYIDPRATAHWASQYLHHTRHIPLILDAHTLFIPFQTRKDVPHGDGCFGYVLASALTTCRETTLQLTNGCELPTLSPPALMHKRLIDAKVLSCAYQMTRS